MTLPASTRYKLYQPVVLTADFIITFPIFGTEDITVYVDGEEVALFSITATFVSGRAVDAIITLDDPVTDVDVEIYGTRVPRRENNYLGGSPELAANLQNDVDALTAVQQEQSRDFKTTLRVSAQDPIVSPLSGTADDRSGRSLIFSPDGTGLEVGPDADEISTAQQYAENAAASAASVEPYPDRATAEAANHPASAKFLRYFAPDGTIVNFAEAVSADPNDPLTTNGGVRSWIPAGVATTAHWGAFGTVIPDGTDGFYMPTPGTDSTSEIQAAFEWCVTRGRDLYCGEDVVHGISSQCVWGTSSTYVAQGAPKLWGNFAWIGAGQTATAKDMDNLQDATINQAAIVIGKTTGTKPLVRCDIRVDGRRLRNPVHVAGVTKQPDLKVFAERGVDCEIRYGSGSGSFNNTGSTLTVQTRAYAFEENGSGVFSVDDTITQIVDPATAVDTGTDVITIAGHGFTEDYSLLYLDGAGGTAIGGLTNNRPYYLINVTTDTFQLSETEGGSAINLTSTGTGTAHEFKQFGTGHYGRNGRTSLGVYMESADSYLTGVMSTGLRALVLGTSFNQYVHNSSIWVGPDRDAGAVAAVVTKDAGRWEILGGKIEDGAIQIHYNGNPGKLLGTYIAQMDVDPVQLIAHDSSQDFAALKIANCATSSNNRGVLLRGSGAGTVGAFIGTFHGCTDSSDRTLRLQGRSNIAGDEAADIAFATRAEAATWNDTRVTNGDPLPAGTILRAGGLAYRYDNGSTQFSDLNNWLHEGDLVPGHYGGTTLLVANLPAAGSVEKGSRAYVTDSNTSTYNAVVAGGGSTFISVVSTGAVWRVG